MIETTFLDPTQHGRVGVIVPHGVLFRGGSEGKLRQQFIEENLLDAVIGLPDNLFFGTGIPAAILIFRRDKQDDTVVFIDASSEYESGTNQNHLRQPDRARIVQTYRQRQFVDTYAYVATQDDIVKNGYNLNIPRYVDTFEAEPVVDIAAVSGEIKVLSGKLDELEARMRCYVKELGLDE